MPAGPRVFLPNRRDVAHESFDDEVILIHFPSGKYFRLDAPGRVAWAAVERGATSADVAAALRASFEADEPEARSSADAFLSSLAGHGLVVEDREPRGATAAAPFPVPSPRAPFHEPRVEVFTDLQQLFLVDPIHEVDEAGWPHAKP
jgi:hypothetical protein